MTTVDPNLKYVAHLDGTSLAIVVVSIICGCTAIPVVALRSYLRLHEQVFGWDDGLMASACTIFIVEVVLACFGARSGLGTPDARLNDYLQVESKKYLMIWMMLYVGSLVLIKSSICVTMLRIGSPIKSLRVAVYALLAFVVGTFLATIIGILLLCNPVRANWETSLIISGEAKCQSMSVMIGLSYFSTASSILTDFACAVLPGIIVWNTQLKKSTKISVCVLLSFGSIACISTMIRTPFIRYYMNPTDNLVYHVGNIVLWSNIESAIGLVAGSLPSLRRLISRRKEQNTDSNKGTGFGLATIGGTAPLSNRKPTNRSYKNPTDLGISVTTVHTRGDGDWSRLQDSEENGHGEENHIRADYTYKVESTRETELFEQNSVGCSSRESIIKRG